MFDFATLSAMLLFAVRMALLFITFTATYITAKPAFLVIKEWIGTKVILAQEKLVLGSFLTFFGIFSAETTRLVLTVIFPGLWFGTYPLSSFMLLFVSLLFVSVGLVMVLGAVKNTLQIKLQPQTRMYLLICLIAAIGMGFFIGIKAVPHQLAHKEPITITHKLKN